MGVDEQPELSPGDVGLGRLFDLIQEAVVVADTAADKILLWNHAAENLFGYSKEEALAMPLHALVPPYLRDEHLHGVRHFNEVGPGPLLKRGEPIELAGLSKDGSEVYIELTLTTLESSGTPHSWVMGVIRDVTGRRDPLTGLWNRRRFEEDATRHLLEAKRYDLAGGFLFIDVDQLKLLNDSYGHQVGDEALKRLASILKRRLRVTDAVGRWGGDEFAVLLPRVDRAHADKIASVLASSLSEAPLIVGGESVRVSASTGVAMYGPDTSSMDDLVREADQSMYATKRAKPVREP
jgi:diguanylate cyclase (GGDEF)-like protein/PAS domain S-box-containing protein